MEQYGFRENHTTELQTLRLTETIIKHINNKHVCNALMKVISKVSVKVWHQGLIYKMALLGIGQGVRQLTNNIIKKRTFHVMIGSVISGRKSISAGMKQGSVLSHYTTSTQRAYLNTVQIHKY